MNRKKSKQNHHIKPEREWEWGSDSPFSHTNRGTTMSATTISKREKPNLTQTLRVSPPIRHFNRPILIKKKTHHHRLKTIKLEREGEGHSQPLWYFSNWGVLTQDSWERKGYKGNIEGCWLCTCARTKSSALGRWICWKRPSIVIDCRERIERKDLDWKLNPPKI